EVVGRRYRFYSNSYRVLQYVTLTAHHITDDWYLSSHVPQTRAFDESHTGANLAELLRGVAIEWNLTDKDPALVTDNASNMVIAAQLTGFLHIKCYAHTLNLALQRALKLPAVAKLSRLQTAHDKRTRLSDFAP
ncbi:E3 SUMO-protein ligase ZBED1-like, partial [Tachysurus ichikawai]